MASFCLLRENSGWFMVLVGISKQLKFVSVFIRLSISSSSSIDLNRVCRIKAEPLSDKLFSHFEHD